MAIIPALVERANKALDNNPPGGVRQLNTHGSDWLFAVTAIFIIAFLAHFLLGFRPRFGERIFHYLFTIGLLVGAICYFAMASDLGYLVISQVNHKTAAPTRQIFYPKFIYWAVSWPIVLIALGLISGLSWAGIIYSVFLAWIWVISYLVSSFVASTYKWAFFVFGTVAWFALAHHTLFEGAGGARRLGIGRDHMMHAGYLNFLWMLYVIAFGLSDGGNKIGVTGSFVFFGILDLLLLPVIAASFLFFSRKWDYNALGLNFSRQGRVPGAAPVYHDKTHPTTHAAPTAQVAAV